MVRFPGADSVVAKGGLIGLVTVLLLWPLGQVASLVSEREAMRDAARETIAARVGERQWIGGPVLRVPVQRLRPRNRAATIQPSGTRVGSHEEESLVDAWEDAPPVYLRAAELQVDGALRTTLLRKGLYRVPAYEATLRLRGHFDAAAAAARALDGSRERLVWSQARLVLPLAALESIRRIERFTLDDARLETAGDAFLQGRALAGLASLAEAQRDRELPFEVVVVLSGSEAFDVVPLAAASTIALRGDWPHPDFAGAESPAGREVGAAGFTASWSSTRLRWTLPEAWRGEPLSTAELRAAGSGVALFQPLDLYALNYRAVRYGVLFVAVTFLALFAWEHATRGVRLHPLQYLLVGLALAVFFLLLLALSEHVGFALAYAIAATALVALIGVYVAGVAASRRVALAMSAALAAAYALLYAILASEDHALLLGALTVFAALATLMIATRRFDWRAPRGGDPAEDGRPAVGTPDPQASGW
jgi:inner membrane protein